MADGPRVEQFRAEVFEVAPPVPGHGERDLAISKRPGCSPESAVVAAVAVDDDGFPTAVVREALDDVADVGRERRWVRRERPVELAVVVADADRDRRQHDHVFAVETPGDGLGGEKIRPERQRRPVLFDGAGRQQRHLDRGQSLRERRGRVFGEEIHTGTTAGTHLELGRAERVRFRRTRSDSTSENEWRAGDTHSCTRGGVSHTRERPAAIFSTRWRWPRLPV